MVMNLICRRSGTNAVDLYHN